jgi:hypothetical protein
MDATTGEGKIVSQAATTRHWSAAAVGLGSESLRRRRSSRASVAREGLELLCRADSGTLRVRGPPPLGRLPRVQ